MNPTDLKYTKEHEWIKIEGEKITMGVTYHAQEQLTDIVFAELPKVGKVVKKGETLAVLESVKAVSDVYSPISGEVIEVNESLVNQPDLINNKPYEDGWIAKLKVSDVKELDNLITSEQYEEFLKSGH